MEVDKMRVRVLYPGEEDCDCGACSMCNHGTISHDVRLDNNLVLIEWRDSATPSEAYWHLIEDAQTSRIVHVVSVGIVVSHDFEQILIAQSVNQLQYGGLLAIPNSAVARLTRLRDSYRSS